MANEERCYYCGYKETDHDLGKTDCANFVSEVQHQTNCPGAEGGCLGSLFCEQAITAAEERRLIAAQSVIHLAFNY